MSFFQNIYNNIINKKLLSPIPETDVIDDEVHFDLIDLFHHSQQHSFNLGIQTHSANFQSAILPLVYRLQTAFSPDYQEKIKQTVMKKYFLNEEEWENRLFETKRYFLMAAIFKSVPMYSREVDEVWREMLTFTREYEDFCLRWIGTFLHHTPHMERFDEGQQQSKPRLNEGSWFDYLYFLLFKPTEYSYKTWGAFFTHPICKEILQDFKTISPQLLLQEYFNVDAMCHVEKICSISEWLISHICDSVALTDEYVRKNGTSMPKYISLCRSKNYINLDEESLLFLSLYHHRTYREKLISLYTRLPVDTQNISIWKATYQQVSRPFSKLSLTI